MIISALSFSYEKKNNQQILRIGQKIVFNERTKTELKQTHIETTSQKWIHKAKIHEKTLHQCENHGFQFNVS